MAWTLVGASLALAGCAGGGGSGTATPSLNLSPPPPPSPAPPPPPSTYPTPSSAEFQTNWGLAAIHADAAFAAGGTGDGVTVGVIDSGVDSSQVDLQGAVSPSSTDIYASRNTPIGSDRHATYLASIIADRFNGFGSVGVAYLSTVLSVRIDTPGSCAGSGGCSFTADAQAQGINYAVAHGARVINLSLGGPGGPEGAAVEQALSHAVASGVVFTISAGNEGAAQPDFPAMYAVDPRYQGDVLAVGASTQSGALASYSNKAGAAAAGYVVAPGDNILTDCSNGSCWQVSGTSFSAAHTAGALALLLQAFPSLTGAQAVSILEKTADSLGAANSYGFGLIDLARAFQPVGTMSATTAQGVVVPIAANPAADLSAAFGTAVSRTQALKTVGYDSYRRLFAIDLASAYRAPPRRALQSGEVLAPQEAAVSLPLPNGARLDLATAAYPASPLDGDRQSGLRSVRQPQADLNLQVVVGRFSFAAWSGEGGMAPSGDMAASRDAFAAVAQPSRAVRAAYRAGSWSFSGEAGGGAAYSQFGLTDLKPSSYALAGVGWASGRLATHLSYGALSEPQGPLGSFLPAGDGYYSLAASTRFLSGGVDWSPNARLAISASAAVGETRAAGGLLQLSGSLSDTWSLSIRTLCDADRSDCLRWSAQIDQPLRLERGTFSAVLADWPAHYSDPLTYSTRSFSATPNGRQLDLTLGLGRSVRGAGEIDLKAIGILDEANQPGRSLNLGALATWRLRFQ